MKQGGKLLTCLFTGNSVYMVFCCKRMKNLLPQRSSRAHFLGSCEVVLLLCLYEHLEWAVCVLSTCCWPQESPQGCTPAVLHFPETQSKFQLSHGVPLPAGQHRGCLRQLCSLASSCIMVINVWDMDILSKADSGNDKSAREGRASPELAGKHKDMAITVCPEALFHTGPQEFSSFEPGSWMWPVSFPCLSAPRHWGRHWGMNPKELDGFLQASGAGCRGQLTHKGQPERGASSLCCSRTKPHCCSLCSGMIIGNYILLEW